MQRFLSIEAVGMEFETKRGRFEALRDVNAAIQYFPQNPDLYPLRADINSSLGKYADALKDVNTAVQLGKPVNPAFVEMLKSHL